MSMTFARPWLRFGVLVAVVAVLPAATAGAGPAERTAHRESAPARTVELIAQRGVLSLPSTPAVGAPFVAGGDLLDPAGTKVGEGYSSCLIAKVALSELTAHCTSAFRLVDGEIHLSSLRVYTVQEVTTFKDGPMAVVGGTGAYRDARGEASTVKQAGDLTKPVSYKFTITLTD